MLFPHDYDYLFPTQCWNLTGWTQNSHQSSHIKGADKDMWCLSSLIPEQIKGEVGEWRGQAVSYTCGHLSQLWTRPTVALYSLWIWSIMSWYVPPWGISVNPLCAKFFMGNKKKYLVNLIIHTIPPHWHDTGRRNSSSCKTRTWLILHS